MKTSRKTPECISGLAFVVATKDRPAELERLLESLAVQSVFPSEIIIVDSGTERIDPDHLEQPLRGLVRFIAHDEASATIQRNLGISRAGPDIQLIGFLDDDVVLEPDAVGKMMEFWRGCPDEVGGVSFNLLNHPALYAADLKSLPLAERIGLYSRERGRVLPSGFQTMLGHVEGTMFVQWLPSGASVWRREIFAKVRFDEWFQGYSYLEDLDFSYRVGKSYRLAVLAGAGYSHYPAPGGRGNGYQFGAREVLHRLHFVAKHPELSVMKCLLSLGVRFLMNLIMSIREKNLYYFKRALGNLAGLSRSLMRSQRMIL